MREANSVCVANTKNVISFAYENDTLWPFRLKYFFPLGKFFLVFIFRKQTCSMNSKTLMFEPSRVIIILLKSKIGNFFRLPPISWTAAEALPLYSRTSNQKNLMVSNWLKKNTVCIEEKFVRNILLQLDASKAFELDGILVACRKYAPQLATFLTRRFHTSYDSGNFPSSSPT